MHERALYFDLAVDRQRARAASHGVVLALTLLLPVEVVGDTPQWIAQTFAEVGAASVLAALAFPLAGLAIVLLRAVTRRPATLSLGILASLATAALWLRIGADASAWELLRLPTALPQRPAWLLLALALAAAGANLSFRPHARAIAKRMLWSSLACTAVYYLWPHRGAVPFVTIGRLLLQVPQLRSAYALGTLVLVGFLLLPLLAVGLALRHVRVPAERDPSIAALVATYSLPGALVLYVYRSLLLMSAGAGILVSLGTAAFVTACITLLSSALEVLGETIEADPTDLELAPGLTTGHAALRAAGVMVPLIALQLWLARPPSKGIAWHLGPPSPAGDELYQQRIPQWSAQLQATRQQHGQSAVDLLELEATERALRSTARAIDPGLGLALEALTTSTNDVDLAGRRFFRLVNDVNEASRRASLPYYIDPMVQLLEHKDGLQRVFRATTFRISAVRPVRVGGRDFATLHVRYLGGYYEHGSRLGFSRDMQPFAVVSVDEIEKQAEVLHTWASSSPPRCTPFAHVDDDAMAAYLRCGTLLADLEGAAQGDRTALQTLQTLHAERHELQHQIDGPLMPIASALDRHMPAYGELARQRVNREFSAYLAQLTGPAPKLGLVHLLTFATLGTGGTEHHVALLVFYTLAQRPIPVAHGSTMPDQGELRAAFDELLALPDAVLQQRAAGAWSDNFGRALAPVPLPSLVGPMGAATPARH